MRYVYVLRGSASQTSRMNWITLSLVLSHHRVLEVDGLVVLGEGGDSEVDGNRINIWVYTPSQDLVNLVLMRSQERKVYLVCLERMVHKDCLAKVDYQDCVDPKGCLVYPD